VIFAPNESFRTVKNEMRAPREKAPGVRENPGGL